MIADTGWISLTDLLLRLGLLLALAVLVMILLWRLWNKRPIKPHLLLAGVLVAVWFSISPLFGWLWCRETMDMVFGEPFSAKIVYSHTPRLEFNGDGTSLFVFKIPNDRISRLVNAAALSGMGLPKQDPEMEGWQTIPWQHAPFLNDTNDVQLLAFSGGADQAFGVSEPQLRDLMKQPSTLFACSYKTAGGLGPKSIPDYAYMASFYILIPSKQQLIVIHSKI